MQRTKDDLCKEYIWQIKMMMDLSDGGPFGLYGLEQHRIRLHESICDAFKIDHDKSKSVLSYLDEVLNFDFTQNLTDNMLDNYAQTLCNYLEQHKNELN